MEVGSTNPCRNTFVHGRVGPHPAGPRSSGSHCGRSRSCREVEVRPSADLSPIVVAPRPSSPPTPPAARAKKSTTNRLSGTVVTAAASNVNTPDGSASRKGKEEGGGRDMVDSGRGCGSGAVWRLRRRSRGRKDGWRAVGGLEGGWLNGLIS